MSNNWYDPHSYGYRNQWNPGDSYNWYRRITIEEAIKIAVERVPGQVVKVELEHEHGRWIYEVKIITPQGVKYEVEVDVNTGRITRVELD
ncbi:PepSY domain-containing protein [Bacillus sp. B190/17]|uniref:PepSY domain-containing protein n=1 Tax=Bacillus lumedeiriae TaxID=3058829 RepID=A0ABW8I7C4_9BACI